MRIDQSGKLKITGPIFPYADSTTAMQFLKADGTTAVMNIDTTNKNVQIGTTSTANNKFSVFSDDKSVTSGTVKLLDFVLSAKASGSSSASYRAVYGQVTLGSNQTITGDFIGFNGELSVARAYKVSNAYGFKTLVSVDAASAAYGNAYGVYADIKNNNATATIDAAYGVYIPAFTATGTITASYGVYQVGTGQLNYFGGATTFAGGITLSTQNIVTDTTTGTKIGTGTTQKIGFWNVTPVVQQAHIADASGGLVVDTEARAAIASINALLATLGLTAAS
jgi:hypothetical protein